MTMMTTIKRTALGLLLASTIAAGAVQAQTAKNYLVFFDFNKADLTPAAHKILDMAIADAKAGKPTKIQVTGHTDTVGSDGYNLDLSRRRAAAVQAELVRKGVPAGIIATEGKGKRSPLVATGDGVKEPQNRRVEIVYTLPAPPKAEPAPKPAEPAPAEKTAEAAAEPPGLDYWVQVETGITAAGGYRRGNKINFGHLFTDRGRAPLLNQVLLTLEQPLDPKATDYAAGFRLQGMYGSDARYTHFLGELDKSVNGRNQLDIVEAWVGFHTPWLTEGGVDFKVGQFPTYLGAEVIDAAVNTFYSKSYIFNFGIPLKHTGVMATAHINDTLDLLGGVNSGVNTSLGNGDNNSAASFQFGFGLNGLMDGKLTVLALSHIGPETPNDNSTLNYLNDIVFTYKPTDKWTLVTEFNYIKTDLAPGADGIGVAQYVSYALDDEWTLSARGEYWNDKNGFFVAAFPGKYDFVNLQKGLPNAAYNPAAGVKTEYGALTFGTTWKPADAPAPLRNLLVRPEVRFDSAINGTRPFKDGTSRDQVTVGIDLVFKL